MVSSFWIQRSTRNCSFDLSKLWLVFSVRCRSRASVTASQSRDYTADRHGPDINLYQEVVSQQGVPFQTVSDSISMRGDPGGGGDKNQHRRRCKQYLRAIPTQKNQLGQGRLGVGRFSRSALLIRVSYIYSVSIFENLFRLANIALILYSLY